MWYRSLIKSQGWDHLANVLKGQAEQRANDILTSIGMKPQDPKDRKDGMTTVLEMEFEKGVRAGILLARDLPRAILEFAESHAEQLRYQVMRLQKGDKQ